MKKRLDVLLSDLGLFNSRSKAVMAIKSGAVSVNGRVLTKPSESVEESSVIEIVGETLKYVSRGGLKLEKAIDVFNIDLTEKTVLDLGSSTGGFTDCALFYGAKKVYAVDIGSNQLDAKLRQDPRVISMENTDAKNLPKKVFDECDIIVADISFVSIVKIVESIVNKVTSEQLMLLIKPQFECGATLAKKHKGIIRDESLSKKIAGDTVRSLEGLGLKLMGMEESPIKGGDGNTEYISLWRKHEKEKI